MDKVKIWNRTDGEVSVTHFNEKDRLSGESDDAMIERISIKLRSIEPLIGAEEIMLTLSDLPNDKKDRMKWRLKADKSKVIVDNSVVTEEEEKKAKKDKAKQELKDLGLTDDAIEAIVNG
jgi:hypothetical protein